MSDENTLDTVPSNQQFSLHTPSLTPSPLESREAYQLASTQTMASVPHQLRQPYGASSLISTIPKLEGSRNFEAWFSQFSGICKLDQVWEVADGTRTKPSQEDVAQYLDWNQANNHVTAIIQLSLKPGPLTYIAGLQDAAEMVAKLKNVYKSSSYTARDLVFRQITRNTLTDYKGIAEYGEAIKKSRIKLQDMGF